MDKWSGVNWAQTDSVIGKKMGVSRQRAHQVRQRMGYPPARELEHVRRVVALAKLDTKNMTYSEISEATGIPRLMVIRMLKKWGKSVTSGDVKFEATGPRPKVWKYDWDSVDWDQPASRIAEQLGCKTEQVVQYRQRHGIPKTVDGRTTNASPVDWASLDWRRPTRDIAEELGYTASYVSLRRRRHAPETLGMFHAKRKK